MTVNTMDVEAGWSFDNTYQRLPELCFKPQTPTPVRSPELVILNNDLASALGLNAKALKSEEGVNVLAGNRVPEGASPIAQAYAGHQFGHFTMLGDGRAVLLGEQLTPQGNRFDIQLKGAGRTPFSRGGDGRAALGPMLREYIISEAMNALNIPTTRSLAVVTTGEPVFREEELQGAVLTRVAASHIRVGTFQYVSRWGSVEDLRNFTDYTLQRHFSDVEVDENRYLRLLQEVIRRQASLIAKWQLVGFIHGVMNTDNMAISGETIDYGPCAFMDVYDPATVFSSIDHQGRYAYGNQPYIAAWNLARFAEALLPLLHDEQEQGIKLAEEALSNFSTLYSSQWLAGMRGKLGIFDEEAEDTQSNSEDETLIQTLLQLMQTHKADYTNTFLALTLERTGNRDLFDSVEFQQWHKQWQTRLSKQSKTMSESQDLMRKSNPAVIPRNHRVEEALDAAEQGDMNVLEKLLDVLSSPYAHTPEQAEYAAPPVQTNQRYRTFCGT